MDDDFLHTAVVGAGGVGCYFGAMLARAGHRVTLIGRAAQVAAIRRDGLRLHKGGRVDTLRPAASTDPAAVHDADLVLVCVKSADTENAARQIAPHLPPTAWVMSLQNGIDNAPTLARQLRQTVVPAAVYLGIEVPEPGVVRHQGRGDLVVGALDAAQAADPAFGERLQTLVALFVGAEVPVTVSPDVMREQWNKLLVACAFNAISGLAQLPYGVMSRVPEVVQLQRAVVREVVAVARAEGITLDFDKSTQTLDSVAAAMPTRLSSTAQDLARRKPSEIDHLNGTIVRRGARLGVPTPANQALHALVKLVEAGHG